MIYTDVRYDASQIILPLLLSRMADLAHTAIKPFYEDLLVIVKSLLTKSSVWSYENEWRMISMLPDNTLFCRIYSLKPTAVYIGVRTDEEAANTLYQICCEKDIPCYKMVPANLRDMHCICGGDYAGKMSLLMDHTARPGNVADPWYTGDFEATWRDVLEGCQGLLKEL